MDILIAVLGYVHLVGGAFTSGLVYTMVREENNDKISILELMGIIVFWPVVLGIVCYFGFQDLNNKNNNNNNKIKVRVTK